MVELPGQGTDDRVFAYVDFTLPDQRREPQPGQRLRPATRGTGNELNNIITGNELANLLQGLAGNDTLTGGLGNDTLDGGSGIDTAVMSGTARRAQPSFAPATTPTPSPRPPPARSDTLLNVEFVQFNGP